MDYQTGNKNERITVKCIVLNSPDLFSKLFNLNLSFNQLTDLSLKIFQNLTQPHYFKLNLFQFSMFKRAWSIKEH